MEPSAAAAGEPLLVGSSWTRTLGPKEEKRRSIVEIFHKLLSL